MAEEKKEVATAQNQTLEAVLDKKLNTMVEALPKDLNKSRFVANAVAFYNASDKLKECSSVSVLNALVQSAVMGLDAYSKECYIIPYGKKAELNISYLGMRKLAIKYATRPIKDMTSFVVRKGDEFTVKVVDGRTTYDFTPLPFNGEEIVGAVAVAEFEDGTMEVETMTKEELDVIRSCSRSSGGVWNKFYSEMCRKTVMRRLCKHIQLDFDNDKQIAIFDEDGAIQTETPRATNVFEKPTVDDNIIDTTATEVE